MPQLISSPEDWFRQKKTSFYQLDFEISHEEYTKLGEKGWKSFIASERAALDSWMDKFMPNVEWVVLGPCEYIGWIMGGPALNSAVLHDKQVHLFRSGWGDHPHWRLVEKRIEDWRQNLDRYVLWDRQAPLLSRTGWADIPGVGHVALVPNGEKPYDGISDALSGDDFYFRLSELMGSPIDQLINFAPSGNFYKGESHSVVMNYPRHDHRFSKDNSHWTPERNVADEKNISALMKFFNLDIPRSELDVCDSEF